MSVDSPLPWTDRQWADLRSVALESARKSRVASTFLPLVGPVPADQATVPSNWVEMPEQEHVQRGEAEYRLEVRAGKSLHLVTISCNVYLRGSEIADPDLAAAKTMVRRAGEVIGRLEDAVIFHGVSADKDEPIPTPIQPQIYTITGGRDLTGLLQAPDTLFESRYRRIVATLRRESARENEGVERAADAAAKAVDTAITDHGTGLMRVKLAAPTDRRLPIIEAIVAAIQRLEERGQFGPFAVVLGHDLFLDATNPSNSLVLPTDRLAEFLDGRKVLRSSILPRQRGVVIALGGQPIELVLANDIDIKFLQMTLEPRYVLQVFERLVLRIKELDAVCSVVGPDEQLWDPDFVPRTARS
jgi:uncharacterized linocin/CFP29 family protein